MIDNLSFPCGSWHLGYFHSIWHFPDTIMGKSQFMIGSGATKFLRLLRNDPVCILRSAEEKWPFIHFSFLPSSL